MMPSRHTRLPLLEKPASKRRQFHPCPGSWHRPPRALVLLSGALAEQCVMAARLFASTSHQCPPRARPRTQRSSASRRERSALEARAQSSWRQRIRSGRSKCWGWQDEASMEHHLLGVSTGGMPGSFLTCGLGRRTLCGLPGRGQALECARGRRHRRRAGSQGPSGSGLDGCERQHGRGLEAKAASRRRGDRWRSLQAPASADAEAGVLPRSSMKTRGGAPLDEPRVKGSRLRPIR